MTTDPVSAPPQSVPPRAPGQPVFHITRLEIDSFKRIVATAISPATGKPVLLTGDNGQGKSSVLDSILWAMTNSGVGKPIMEGKPSAVVGVQITDGSTTYIIKRRAKGENRYLEVLTGDGEEVKKPQAFLNSLVGNLAFDPEAFARLKEKDQSDQLRQATGLDTAELDEEIKRVFTLRTAANREETAAEAAYKAAPAVAGEPMEALSAGGLAAERDTLRDELKLAADTDVLVDAMKRDRRTLEQGIDSTEQEIARLKSILADKRASLAEMDTEISKGEIIAADKLKATKDHPARIDKLTADLDGIYQKNAEILIHNRALELRTQRRDEWRAVNKKAADLNDQVEALRAKRAKLITDAKMPVEGLAIEDDVVTLDGIPLGDLNTAKRIEVATRIAIAQNPRLGVIFVREGALINDTNLGIIAAIAEEHGMQLWIEKFQPEAGSTGLHIVDGMIATENGKPAAPVQQDLL